MAKSIESPNALSESRDPQSFVDYRAPRRHGECLVAPSLGDAGQAIDKNIERFSNYPNALIALRGPGRNELIRDAKRYTSAYRDVSSGIDSTGRIVMAGHQPTLFHPGVWFKNFALDHVARQTGSTGINLVVDSDAAGASSIRVPTRRSEGGLGYQPVLYDGHGGGVPYEQALIGDRSLFDSFDARVKDAVGGIVADPLVRQLWAYAKEAINRCGFAGCALAQARHRLEADLGLLSLEIPQSVVCRSETFAEFAMQILVDLPRFHDCYNGAADIYRHAHGIRSNAHPVPNLKQDDGWYEAPFWVYGNQSPNRKSVWVRVSSAGTRMELSDRDRRHREIDLSNRSQAAEALASLASPEFKLRSRALVTTMYSRLVLSDLFLHGIGGGKYDQLGDLISGQFWGIQTPELMVISSTVLLPGHEAHPISEINQRSRELKRRLRDIQYQPERIATAGELPEEWLLQKQRLLANVPERGNRHDWHIEISKLNDAMSGRLSHVLEETRSAKALLENDRRQAEIWNSREHSFCIYPLAQLQAEYESMLRQSE